MELFVFASAIIMLINAFLHQIKFENLTVSSLTWDPSSSYIGLFNWIPLFFCFIGFQNYLNSIEKRKITSKILIAGSVPVLVSGFAQHWFNWYGPLETLNGLIIWYQSDKFLGLTGLFNNPNYTGCWLNIIWPFSIAVLMEKTRHIFVKASSLLFILAIATALFLTASRSGFGGLLLNIPLVLMPVNLNVILTILSLLVAVILMKISNIFPENLTQFLNTLLPAKFDMFSHLFEDNFEKPYRRDTIIFFALEMLIKNPILGLGAASFPLYYYIKNDIYIGHAHNLIVDIAFSYGIIVAIFIFTNIFFLICFLAFRKHI